MISVIIPAHNAAPYLNQALESVLGQQGNYETEIIVVDDGSTDDTARVAKSFASVTYRHQEQQGAAAARNNGVSLCQGQYVAFLDADDLFAENKFVLQVPILEADPQIEAVFGHVSEFAQITGSDTNHRKPVDGPLYSHATMIARRELLEKVGAMNTSLRIGEFVDWYSRARALGINDVMIPEIVLKRRLHSTNVGAKETASSVNYASVMRAHLNRMRQAGKAP